ncbi:SDR family oxidoreductase [Sphingomonas sp. CGMCC 1.13654]|uniref:SDR family oxidoreductase n=1 Tax=Sphingomonas chungangi TaxID=2683589 RepID=A0A838L552_9SPHN|nr:SDR family oxidoreductase [Sphingomonas chungangi]MBA2933825.1 SDR family oxidoreductase [Sphingomonas chungangi]MVW55155.1 SDR family oxidoreductase [Sphingomonas chungangi]
MYAPFDLTGKTVLVTGGNIGIGLAMGQALADAGADIVLWGSNAERNECARNTLAASGRHVLAQRVDVTDEAAIVAAMAEAIAEMGRIDTVIANAGTGGIATPFVETTANDLRRVLAINLDGAYFTAREACRHMVARARMGDPGGSIVLVGSAGTDSGMPRFGPYAASKGALAPLMRSILAEHARHGIRVNLIQPGFIRTEMTDHFREKEKTEEWILASIPQRRWGHPTECGGIAIYLASDASSYQSGSTITIDGGFLAS